MKNKQTIVAVDFDGVINSYTSGFCGVSRLPDPPTKGAKDALQKLKNENCYIMIFSTRASNVQGRKAIELYCYDNQIPFDEVYMGFSKPFADVYVDDKAVTFKGDWNQTANDVLNFKNYMMLDPMWIELKPSNDTLLDELEPIAPPISKDAVQNMKNQLNKKTFYDS